MDDYTPAALSDGEIAAENLTRDDLIGVYYQIGYRIREIMGFMTLRHNIPISERQIYRVLRSMNLLRRGNESALENIVQAVYHELNHQNHVGYRIMHRRVLSNHHLNVTAETVRRVLSVLDREGVLARSHRIIRRRIYSNPGPNFAIHMDGWDKLKPYGVSIHAALYGYSRRIMWLKACDSNKNSHYVAYFFLNYIREINGVPVLVYSDRGAENSVTRDLQYTLRWNYNDQYQGLSSYNLHLECIRFSFMDLINQDLFGVVRQWNEHTIRMDDYTPAALSDGEIAAENLTRDDLIGVYYQIGYRIGEIIGFMTLRHNIPISERQIHRVLRSMNLLRRGNESALENIVQAVYHELNHQNHVGYRIMHRRVLSNHHLNVTAETVRRVLSVLDREGVLARSHRIIRRRIYSNPGPNFAIHMDGWDKLKPYGVSIHAALYGYSRRIMWLKACDSNKNSHYVAYFFLNYIREINWVPVLVYSDNGTENSVTRDLQYTLRWNHNGQYQGLSSYNLHLECIRFCFMDLINQDLFGVVRQWNEHTIRYNSRSEGPFGKPDVYSSNPRFLEQ